MNRDKIQVIFFYCVIALLILGIGGFGYYFYLENNRWQSYKNDPAKKQFFETIENIANKNPADITNEEYLTMGNAYEELGEFKKAAEAYQSSIDKGPTNVAQINLAGVYASAGEYKKAQDKYLEIVEKNWGLTDVFLKLAELYKKDWDGKKYDQLSILIYGLEKNPNNYELLVNLGMNYKEVGNKEKALEYLQKAYEINTANESLKSDIAELKK